MKYLYSRFCYVKVKFSRTCYRALGPELIQVYRLSSPPVTKHGSRLTLLSARPAITFPVEERHRSLAGTELYCLVTEAHACEQLAQDCHLEADPQPFVSRVNARAATPHRPKHL